MTKNKAVELGKEIDEAIKVIAEKHGLIAEQGGGRFTSNEYRTKIVLIEKNSCSVNESKLPAGVSVGDEFLFRNVSHKVVGSKRGRKFDWILASSPSGTVYKFNPYNAMTWKVANKVTNRTKKEILNDIRDVEAALSPENLSCDGELSKSQIVDKKNTLERKLKNFYNELGYVPTYNEVYLDEA